RFPSPTPRNWGRRSAIRWTTTSVLSFPARCRWRAATSPRRPAGCTRTGPTCIEGCDGSASPSAPSTGDAAAPRSLPGLLMRRRTLARVGACAVATLRVEAASAQEIQSTARSSLPRDVRREAVDRWNGQNALRATEQAEIAAGQQVSGNVAVQHGPLLIAGHVTGNVLALNANVVLRATAHVDGALLVIGGRAESADSARVDGGIRMYADSLVY